MADAAERFGRYEVRGVLGRGGFATVYRAHDPLLGRDVALKALLPALCAEPEDRARFLTEARALARLRHPHIVAVYDVGEAAGRPFFPCSSRSATRSTTSTVPGWCTAT
jgi:serine/threonine protein kinase